MGFGVITLAWAAAFAVPSALWLRFVWRVPPQRDPALAVWGTWAAGMIVAVPTVLAERAVLNLTGISSQVHIFGAPSSLLFLVLLKGPLDEAAKVAAAWPAFRSSHFDEAYDGLLYATASATGFGAACAAMSMASDGWSTSALARVATIFVAQPMIASLWGYTLGRVRQTQTPTLSFTIAWVASSLVHGLLVHVSDARSLLARIATVPVIAGLAFVMWWLGRDLLSRFGRPSRLSGSALRYALPPPSLNAMRQAFHRSEAPVLFHWIGIGALTTTGVMISMVVGAIWAGRRMGLDFSAIDRAETSDAAAVPLVLLTTAVLAAFPVSGYLVTKASRAAGVLEPALSAALAIVAVLVMLGLAAPVALVFAIAFAPIAFALACAGSWLGMGRT